MKRLLSSIGAACVLALGMPTGVHAEALCFPDGTQGVVTTDSGLHLLAELEEASGTRFDSSPKGNDLTPINDPGRSTDHQQGDFSLELLEASSQYLERLSGDLAPGFPGNVGGAHTQLTVGGWAQIFSTGKHPLIVKVNDDPVNNLANQRAWSMWIWDFGDGHGPVFDPNVFADGTDATTAADFRGTTTVQVNTWYHFVYTYDGTTGTSNLYVNGVLDAGPFDEKMNDYFAGSAPLDVGFRPGFGVDNTFLDGRLDEVFALDRVLSAAEVASVYQFGILPPAAKCDDGNACNGVETCDPQAGCQPGTALTCDDGKICNGVETCDPATGCVAGTAPPCDDANLCTIDTCDDQVPGGCVHSNAGVLMSVTPSSVSPNALFGSLNKPGKNTLSVRGTLTLPFPFNPALDPLANGIEVQLLAEDGSVLAHFAIPGGAKDPVTKIGWTVNKKGTTWKYTDPTGGVGGITSATVKLGKTPGQVRVTLKGKGSFGVARGVEPLSMQILAGSDASQCGEIDFAGPAGPKPACAFNKKGTALKCK